MPTKSKAKSQKPKVSATKVGVWRGFGGLARSSIGFYRKNTKSLIWITAIVAVPSALLSLLKATNDATVASYLSLASTLMSLALIWSILQIEAGKKVKAKQAYYFGTASFLRFLLLVMLLALSLLPFIVGVAIFTSAVYASAVPVGGADLVLLALLLFVLSLPTFWLITSYIFSLFEVNGKPDATPAVALKASRALVKGRGWWTLAELLLLFVLALGLMILPTALFLGLYVASHGSSIYLVLLQLTASFLVLPISYIYLNKLRLTLSKKND